MSYQMTKTWKRPTSAVAEFGASAAFNMRTTATASIAYVLPD